jgi:hypothetical protein
MLKAGLRRVRGFMLAEVMAALAGSRAEIAGLRAEVSSLRAELARRDELVRGDLAPVLRKTEEALLTIALNSREQGKRLSRVGDD